MKKTIVGIMMFLMLVMGFNCLCFAESGGGNSCRYGSSP